MVTWPSYSLDVPFAERLHSRVLGVIRATLGHIMRLGARCENSICIQPLFRYFHLAEGACASVHQCIFHNHLPRIG